MMKVYKAVHEREKQVQGIAQRDEYECRPDQTGPAGFLPVGRCG